MNSSMTFRLFVIGLSLISKFLSLHLETGLYTIRNNLKLFYIYKVKILYYNFVINNILNKCKKVI